MSDELLHPGPWLADPLAFDQLLLAHRFVGEQLKTCPVPPLPETIAAGSTDSLRMVFLSGVLAGKTTPLLSLFGMASYSSLKAALSAAAADDTCKGILLAIRGSSVGLADGLMDACLCVAAVAATKPVIVHAEDALAGAALLIAAHATEIWCTRATLVGGQELVEVVETEGRVKSQPSRSPLAEQLNVELNTLRGVKTGEYHRHCRTADMMQKVGLIDKVGTQEEAMAALQWLVAHPESEAQ